MDFFEKLQSIGIIPVVKINDAAKAVPLAQALLAGGIPAIEITFRTEAALEAIRQIVKYVPEVCVCAGTVLTVETAKQAIDSGAAAIISPGINPDVIRWCIKNDYPVIPGCATPSEVEACIRLGLHIIKLFPAEVIGGVKMLKALSGPYAGIKFMPTGGISEKNVSEYLSTSNVLCCGGSWMVPETMLNSGDFTGIEKLAQEASLLCRKNRHQF